MKQFLSLAAALTLTAFTCTSASAATVTVTKAEVSAGLDYVIGFAATVEQGTPTDSRSTPGSVGVGVNSTVSGVRPVTGEFNSASINGSASGAIALDAGGGAVAPGISGTLAGALAFTKEGSVSAAGGNARSDLNFVDYEFVVSGGPVSYVLNYSTDVSSQILLRGSSVSPIVLAAADTTRTGILAADTYTLRAFHAFGATAGGSNPSASGNTSFTLSFGTGTTLDVATIPLPAGLWLMLGALGGLAGLSRARRARA